MDRLSSLVDVFFRNTKARRRRRAVKVKRQTSRQSLLEALEDRRMMTAVVSITGHGEAAEDESSSSGWFVISRDTTSPDPLTVYFSKTGSAIELADYESIGTSAVIPANQLSVTVPINALPDNDVEPTETTALTIEPGTGYTGAGSSATVNVIHCLAYYIDPKGPPPSCSTCFGVGEATNGSSNGFTQVSTTGGTMNGPAGGGVINPDLLADLLGGGQEGVWNPEVALGGPTREPTWRELLLARPSQQNNGTINSFAPSGFSSHPVRYADGVVMVSSQDLQSDSGGAWTPALGPPTARSSMPTTAVTRTTGTAAT